MSTLKRKESLRDSYARRMKAEGRYTSFEPRNKAGHIRIVAKQRKPLKKQSRSQKARLKIYFAARNEWLQRTENAACAICLCRGMTPQAATETHHARGRAGKLLFDTRFWVASCRSCRDFPHQNPREAREMGILSSPVDWNVSAAI